MHKLNKQKYQQAILYFIQNCNNQYLGQTKLNKLMYYLDFISYRDRKKSITNDIYIHKDYGPVPKKIDEILGELNSSKKISVDFIPYKDGYTADFTILAEPNMKVFNTYEKSLLEAVCQKFHLWSTKKIVAQTHLEAPWFYSSPLEEVDYNYSNDIGYFQDSSDSSLQS